MCPVLGIVCIFCRPTSIDVDSRVIVSFVSIGFSCSTCIRDELFVVVCDAFCRIIDEFNCEKLINVT